jgi:hypothetical protein
MRVMNEDSQAAVDTAIVQDSWTMRWMVGIVLMTARLGNRFGVAVFFASKETTRNFQFRAM